MALTNQWPIDQLQPGDVLVIDLYGKQEGAGIVGDNLYYYIMKATKGGGLVINGSVRDLEGISEIELPAYVRSITPTWFGGSTLYGYNVPVRMGNVVVMPGDIAFGDREGVSFIPPSLAESILDKADETHVHDEWTKMKFDEGKYKSTDIYSAPKTDALRKEYQEYLQKKLNELKAARAAGKGTGSFPGRRFSFGHIGVGAVAFNIPLRAPTNKRRVYRVVGQTRDAPRQYLTEIRERLGDAAVHRPRV